MQTCKLPENDERMLNEFLDLSHCHSLRIQEAKSKSLRNKQGLINCIELSRWGRNSERVREPKVPNSPAIAMKNKRKIFVYNLSTI